MTTTTVNQKPKRSIVGKIIKYTFIAFNLLMLLWLVGGVNAATETVANTDVEQAAKAVGTGIGVLLLLFVWGVGDLILGMFVLFTRP